MVCTASFSIRSPTVSLCAWLFSISAVAFQHEQAARDQAGSLRSPTMSAMIIRNGRVVDPANRRDEIADLYISDGKVVGSKSEIRGKLTRSSGKSQIEEIDAKGLIVAP